MERTRHVGLSRPAQAATKMQPPRLQRSSGSSYAGSETLIGNHQKVVYVIHGEKPHEPGDTPEIMIYIGETNHLGNRWQDHLAGTCVVTSIYKPKCYLAITICLDKYTERNVTLEYMREYGIDNVRGGPWTKIDISADERKNIKQMICSEDGSCYRCNNVGHYANTCTVATRAAYCREQLELARVTNVAKLFADAASYRHMKRDLEHMQNGRDPDNMHETTAQILQVPRKRVLPDIDTAPNSQD